MQMRQISEDGPAHGAPTENGDVREALPIGKGLNYLNTPEIGATWCARCWRPRVDPDDQDALTEAREAGIVVCCCDRDDTGGSN